MEIIDIEPGDARITAELLPVLRELRPDLTAEAYVGVYDEGYGQGLRFTGAYTDEGRCVGVAGWRVVANTNRLRMLYVDDLVTAAEARSTGVGRALLGYLEERGRELGCTALHLDSGTHRRDAHRFYMRERMTIAAFHFAKELD
ncbi:GNAT family N-acetyltransferase [Glycomyces harbinensis]|uniref:Acetyltransferase (GNAT) family protein n=1 Tax=Glycomyces harbinensis TaxID=58114 RepID=A0A1G7A1Q2_9ACTN|nr:GNAT family N-acetyltransferase [Glycomyces harbinensis]SDE08563.1 Acetyltransferase (GNAT) family protein [Glycomyces harbinensis]